MTLLLVSAAGGLLFLWPFLGFAMLPQFPAIGSVAAMVTVLVAVEVSSRRLDARRFALLAVVAATDAALRMMLVMGIAGFSPVFFLILCSGYIFGANYGFLCGATALLTSALVTGGIGPWLPYEMIAAGWAGAAAGLAGNARRGTRPGRIDVGILAGVAMAVGFGYGAVMDIWDWSLLRGVSDVGWMPGLSPQRELGQFAHFYLATSLVWDTARAIGTAMAVIVIGRPVISGLARLSRRFDFQLEAPAAPGAIVRPPG